MADLVDADLIEGIVGVHRHPVGHYGRAVSADQHVYVLHSRACLGRYADLRDCPYSRALDRGIDPAAWPEDTAVLLAVSPTGRLVPA